MSGFILTSQMLRDKNACDQWQEIFDFRCPNGLPLNDTEDLVRAIKLGGFGPVVRWFLEYFPEESEHLKIEGKLDLAGANLARAYLAGASLARAYLARASLAGANLSDANLAGANLADANLAGASLAGAKNLTSDQIKSAYHNHEALILELTASGR